MPETPASIITLNFDEKGLAQTKQSAKELEGIFGRVGGTFENLARNIAGLAGVAGIGQIVHQFMRMEQAATRTALAVNNIRGGDSFTKAFAGAQSATGIDAVDLAGGVRASQQFAGGTAFRSARAAGGYGTFLGHMAQATGIDATTLGVLLGQGQAVAGQHASQSGAQALMAQAATAAARAGQAGFSGEFLQGLQGLVRQTGFFGRGSNRGQMAAFMGAAMKGDPAFADPAAAANAVGNVTGVIQGALGNPRLMAALQMSGSNVYDVMNGDPRAAQRLARFARSQGKLPSDLFFFDTFGQEGGRLMRDLADGKITPGQFSKEMKKTDPQNAMKELMERSKAAESTTVSELKKLEGTVVEQVAGPLQAIRDMLASILGNETLTYGILGAIGGAKLGKGINRMLNKRNAGRAGQEALEGAAKVGGGATLGKMLGKFGKLGMKAIPGASALSFLLDADDLDDGDWTVGESRGVMKKLESMTPGQARKYLKKRIKSYEYDGKNDVTDQELKMVEILQKMLQRLDKIAGGGGATNKGASFLPGGAQAGAASGNMMAAFVAGGGGGGLAGISSLYPGGVGSLGGGGGGGGGAQIVPASFDGGGSGGGGGGIQSVAALVALAQGAGLKGQAAAIAAAVAKAESGGDPNAHNTKGEDSRGLWQINVAPGANPKYARWNLFNPSTNARAMAQISGGGRNWGPWTMFKNGTYLQYMDEALAAIGKRKKKGGRGLPPGAQSASVGGGVGGGGGGGRGGSGGGGEFGGMAIGGGFPEGTGGGTTTINVNLDNRRIEQSRRRARAM